MDLEATLVEEDFCSCYRGGPPDGEGPPDGGGPPNGNHLDPPQHPDRRGPPGPRGLSWTNKTSSLIQQPQVVLDTMSHWRIHLITWDNPCYN